jgi:HemY protein
MAKKVNQSAEEKIPAPAMPRSSQPRLPWWVWAALLASSVALTTTGVWWWRQPSLADRVQVGLPAPPDLTGKPIVLAERLTKAQAGAVSPGEVLLNIAELGRLYHANGFNQEAAACWRLLQAKQPREARWCYYLADSKRIASDYAAMYALVARTTELAPDYAPAWLLLAGLEFKIGKLESAQRDYEKRLQLLPGDPYARLSLARIALQKGNSAEARRLIEQLLKDTPAFSSAHNLYAEMLATAGDTKGAERQRLLGRNAGRFREADDPWLDELWAWCYDFDKLCAQGALELQTGHGDRARSYYERAIQLRPRVVTGYEFLGALYIKLKDPAKARDTLEQCLPQLKDSRPSLDYFFYLSQAYQDLKQPAEVVRVAREGLRQIGENLELYSLLGTALSDLGRTDEALTAFHRALVLNPNASNPNYNLGLLFLNLGRRDDAIAALKRSLILQPTFPDALSLLGRIEMEAGNREAAEHYLRPLIESHPEIMSGSHLRAGAEAEAKHDMVAAERHYREGVALDPNHAELQVSLGMLRLVQGRFAEAREPFEAYHRLQPKNPKSCMLLGEVYAMMGRHEEARHLLMEGAELADMKGDHKTANHCREILRDL